MPHSETYIDGVRYPSVTEILGSRPKPWLEKWRDRWGALAERKTVIATGIGTELHRCIESYIETGHYAVMAPCAEFSDGKGYPMPSCIPRVEGMMRSFLSWANTVSISILGTERKVISHVHRYSGTLDAHGEETVKRRVIRLLLDWKAKTKLYPDVKEQVAAYAGALAEETGWKADEGLAVNVSRQKPHFPITIMRFKLGKRLLNRFLRLREQFEEDR